MTRWRQKVNYTLFLTLYHHHCRIAIQGAGLKGWSKVNKVGKATIPKFMKK